MRMIISSSDGKLNPRQKCSIHSKMVQEDMLPTAMPFFLHLFFVYLKGFVKVKSYNKSVRITHSWYPISHIRIPSAASVHEPDKILAAHIASFPFDNPRQFMRPRIINPATLNSQHFLPLIKKEPIEFWISHDFQCGSVKRNPPAAKIERDSRMPYVPICVLLITHSTASPKGRTCPLHLLF